MNSPFTKLTTEDFAGIRKQLNEAETLPPWCYTAPEFFEIEIDRIFSRVWNFVGHCDRVPAPGSYFTTVVANVPLVVARGPDGAIRAFQNTCRHRGTIVALGEGTTRIFTCPYHSWAYDLTGKLISAPHMNEARDFNHSANGLRQVRADVWAGFIFVNLDLDAEDLRSYLGDLSEAVAPYRLDDMTCTRRREYDVQCNWKIYVENAKDSEHLATVHRSSINRTSPSARIPRRVVPSRGNYANTFMRNGGSAALLAGDPGFPKIPSLSGELAEGTTAPLIFPATYLGCTVDCAWYINIKPVSVDRIRLEVGGLFPRAVTQRPDFEKIAANYHHRWDTTAEEDNRVCELQHTGLVSRQAIAGRLSAREGMIHFIDNWILDRVFEETDSRAQATGDN